MTATIEISIGSASNYFSNLNVTNKDFIDAFKETFQNESTPGLGTFHVSDVTVETLSDTFQIFEPNLYNNAPKLEHRILLDVAFTKSPEEYFYPLPSPSKQTSILVVMLTNYSQRVNVDTWPSAQLEIARRPKEKKTDPTAYEVGLVSKVQDAFDSTTMSTDDWRGFFTRVRAKDDPLNRTTAQVEDRFQTNTYQTYTLDGGKKEESFVYSPIECMNKSPHTIPSDPCVFIKPKASFWENRSDFDFFLRIRKNGHQHKNNFADYQMWYGTDASVLPSNNNTGSDTLFHLSLSDDADWNTHVSIVPDNGIPKSMKVGYMQYFLDRHGFTRIINTEGDVIRTVVRLTIQKGEACDKEKTYSQTLVSTRIKKEALGCNVYQSAEQLKDECSSNNVCGGFMYSAEDHVRVAPWDPTSKEDGGHVGCIFPFYDMQQDILETDKHRDLSFTPKNRSCAQSLKYVMSPMMPKGVAYDAKGMDLIPNAEFVSGETAEDRCLSDLECVATYKNAKGKYVLQRGLMRSVNDVDMDEAWEKKTPDGVVQEDFKAKLLQNTLCNSMGCVTHEAFRNALHNVAITALNKTISTKNFLLFPNALKVFTKTGEMSPLPDTSDEIGFSCNWLHADFRFASLGVWGKVDADVHISVYAGDLKNPDALLRKRILLKVSAGAPPNDQTVSVYSSFYMKNGYTFVDLTEDDKNTFWFGDQSVVNVTATTRVIDAPTSGGWIDTFFATGPKGLKLPPNHDPAKTTNVTDFQKGIGYVNISLEHFPRTEHPYNQRNIDPPTVMELFNNHTDNNDQQGIQYVNGYLLLGDPFNKDPHLLPQNDNLFKDKNFIYVVAGSVAIILFLFVLYHIKKKKNK